MIKALIFDFDGLIIDSETPDYLSWVEIYDQFKAELSREKWSSLVGGWGTFDPYQYLEDQIEQELDRGELRTRRRKRYRELCEQKPILPGVAQMIQQAKARTLKLAVASNSIGEWVNSHLKRLELYDYFDVVVTRDQVSIGKPNPEMYLKALDLLGITANEAIAFEDSRTGSMGAKRAGIYTIAIPNEMTRNLDFSHCDHVVASMQLLNIDDMIQRANSQSSALD
jgi:HAD superfamily hydrolase (TIGR01509 family)